MKLGTLEYTYFQMSLFPSLTLAVRVCKEKEEGGTVLQKIVLQRTSQLLLTTTILSSPFIAVLCASDAQVIQIPPSQE